MKEKKVGGIPQDEFDVSTQGQLPSDFNSTYETAAKKSGKSTEDLKNQQISPAVQRELSGKEVWWVCNTLRLRI